MVSVHCISRRVGATSRAISLQGVLAPALRLPIFFLRAAIADVTCADRLAQGGWATAEGAASRLDSCLVALSGVPARSEPSRNLPGQAAPLLSCLGGGGCPGSAPLSRWGAGAPLFPAGC